MIIFSKNVFLILGSLKESTDLDSKPKNFIELKQTKEFIDHELQRNEKNITDLFIIGNYFVIKLKIYLITSSHLSLWIIIRKANKWKA